MKKIVWLPLLVLSLACAENTEETKRVQTMQNLEHGMETILKGMMYNNKSILIKGVDAIQENTKDINSFDIKNEEGKSFKPKEYSETEAKAISSLAEDIMVSFKKANRSKMLDKFRKLQNQCMNCHALIRKW